MTIGLDHYLALSAALFMIGVLGVIMHHRNVITMLMSIEIMLLATLINFVAFSNFLGNLVGQIFSLMILAVAAAETAIGLAILVIYFRNREDIDVDHMIELRG